MYIVSKFEVDKNNIKASNILIQYRNSEIQLWDLSGKKSLQKLWEKYFDELDALVYIIDITTSNLNNSIFTLSNILFYKIILYYSYR